MSRFNTRAATPSVSSPVTATGERTTNHQGGAGFLRDAKSELFLLAVGNFVGTDTFYETGGQRDDRFTQLIRQLAVEDPAWTGQMLGWLRGDGNMRTAAIVGAAEFVKARLDADKSADPGGWNKETTAEANVAGGWNRRVIASVLKRADEPGELLAYWTSRYGRRIPKPVKRGIEDAVGDLYTEKSLLKYDTATKGYRFGDVIELVHPTPKAPWQGDLFKHAIDRRHGRDEEIPASLRMLGENILLRADARAFHERPGQFGIKASGLLHADRVKAAGMAWEDVLSLGGTLGLDKRALWEAVIPSMGIFALVRNLRNFDQAGVSDDVAERVAARICDPETVAKSRMLPFRFWAAYKHTESLRWGQALEKALNLSLANVPALPGRTLVLVDRSPSMFPGYPFSTPNTSDITLAEQAAVFGSALAVRASNSTLVQFGIANQELPVPKGGSVLRLVDSFGQFDGTDIPSAVKWHFKGHDRIVVVTDEQTRSGWFPSNAGRHGGLPETEIDALVPKDVPVYMWNMAGYKAGAAPSGGQNRHAFGGLTDQAFRMIPLLESGRDANWPWES